MDFDKKIIIKNKNYKVNIITYNSSFKEREYYNLKRRFSLVCKNYIENTKSSLINL